MILTCPFLSYHLHQLQYLASQRQQFEAFFLRQSVFLASMATVGSLNFCHLSLPLTCHWSMPASCFSSLNSYASLISSSYGWSLAPWLYSKLSEEKELIIIVDLSIRTARLESNVNPDMTTSRWVTLSHYHSIHYLWGDKLSQYLRSIQQEIPYIKYILPKQTTIWASTYTFRTYCIVLQWNRMQAFVNEL